MKIVDSMWFDKIGIVKIDNGYETKWYIGVGQGHNKELDEKRIMHMGNPVIPKTLERFFTPVKVQEKLDELEALKQEHLRILEERNKNNQQT